ncbi:hypothetical protein VRU48_08715 [Pedobacter sp. KR3-3]|uniref:S1 motif domain-containing protein n=1 Tax=Pedobacter albus TaxID=3113905 RepID=A0ABU7I750_9SPHI|nr:hypothetical protein [Pedobacter sp. KR3-3]MEE1945187.1 hypothetical protein [Pedobacter sp. KR3-3]
MPDKEFDNLFKDKFMDAEIAPSANLWANIEQQLTPKRKRSFPIYWMAAASVAVAITALLVFQKTEKIRLHGATAVATTGQTEEPITTSGTVIAEETMTNTASNKSFANAPVKNMQVRTAENVLPENNLEKKESDLQPNATIAHLPIKKIEIEPMNVVPKEATVAVADNSQTMMASAEVPQRLENVNTISETEVASEKKGIRNVGDLVNFVVEKIDKRDKKLIRFNTDDDDNSSIIGINLGFVRLNPKNKNRN